MALQHLRSSTANKRPLPAAMADGQLAANTNTASPGLFFKDSAGELVKLGPVHVGTAAPNASPAAGGETGNTTGELWLDTSVTPNQLKTWNGSAWVSDFPDEIPVAKLADGAARQLLQTDAAGTGVEWTSNVDVPGTLDVTGATTLDSTLTVPLGSAAAPTVRFTGDTNTGIYSPGADQVAVATNGTGRLFIDASGQVGVGTSGPQCLLDLYGLNPQVRIRGDAATYYPSFSVEGVNGALFTTSYLGPTLTATNDASNAPLTFRTGGTTASGPYGGFERLRITSAGLVGIGTSSPAGRLEIKDNGYRQGIVLERAGTSVDRAFIYIGDGTNSTAADDFYLDAYNAAIHFRQGAAGTTDTVTFTSSGNVGIGTTSPGHLLQVSDKFAVDTSNTFGRIYLQRQPGTSLTTMYIQGADQANTASDLSIVNTSGGGSAIEIAGGTSPAAIKFFTNGPTTERARIDSSGRLLVGTSTATANGGVLELSGGITFPATAVAASNANTLDDYEEGTWTPTHVSGLASGGFSGAAGTYTKIGPIVTVRMVTNFTAGGGTASLSSKLIIGGLPFSANTGGGPTVGGENNGGAELPWSVSNTRTDGSQMIINATAYPTSASMNRLDVNSTYSLV